ncbi:MAG: hypothetical protein KI792_13290 [Alphaproteobacteria bacterium]|nr:hypothetical protein [Alphaproteobacteria bacterium SS10]
MAMSRSIRPGLLFGLLAVTAISISLSTISTAPAQAFNPSCDERGKAIDIELVTANPNRPGASSEARDPIRMAIPFVYLPVPGEYYGGETVSLILRATWPGLGPACLDLTEFPENMEQDPFALMQARFNSLITLHVARMAGPGLDAELAGQQRRAPFEHGTTEDGSLRIYKSVSGEDGSEEEAARPPARMSPFGALPMMQEMELLLPVDPLNTKLAWMTCLRLPIPGAPNQCQARIQVSEEIQAEISFNRDLLPKWREACDETVELINRFIDTADSEPL